MGYTNHVGVGHITHKLVALCYRHRQESGKNRERHSNHIGSLELGLHLGRESDFVVLVLLVVDGELLRASYREFFAGQSRVGIAGERDEEFTFHRTVDIAPLLLISAPLTRMVTRS